MTQKWDLNGGHLDRARRIGLWLLWVGMITYAYGYAPPFQSNTIPLIQALVLGQWGDINPLVVALFNLMGLWPVIYAAVALVDGRSQSFPVWPFVMLSFGLGAFALLPYLALRQPGPASVNAADSAINPGPTSSSEPGTTPLDAIGLGPPDLWIKRTESRWVALLVLIIGTGLLLFGGIAGSWSDFVSQWQTSQFIHVMSLDFCVLSLLFPLLLKDDMARRGLEQGWIVAAVAIAPFIGPALYLCLRPPLLKND